MLDNGFDFYERLAERAPNGLVDGVLFDVNVVPQASSSASLAAARIEANAARAGHARRRRPAAAPRVSGGEGAVGAGRGPRPPASFGLLVRDVNGRQVTASQLG